MAYFETAQDYCDYLSRLWGYNQYYWGFLKEVEQYSDKYYPNELPGFVPLELVEEYNNALYNIIEIESIIGQVERILECMYEDMI